MSTIKANNAGFITGKFTIPANVKAGSKRVEFIGAGGSRGEAIFSGQGTLLRQAFRQETSITETRWQSPPPPPPRPAPIEWDPLAQTFSIDRPVQIAALDLWFTAKGSSAVVVQIRETTAGVPNRNVLAESRINPSIITINGTHTRVAFVTPISLLPGQEYAIVVLCDDADTALAIAELGKWDNAARSWVTSQPYQVGVLLSSSNGSTWTPHQDRDLAFRVLSASYNETNKAVNLGVVSVTNATDLLLMAYAEQPSAQTTTSYQLNLPDGQHITVADGQSLRLPAPITGSVGVYAYLKGTVDTAPILHPGSQLVAGTVATTADYVSRAIPAGTDARVRVIFDALIPSGASVTVAASGVDTGDTWQAVAYLSSIAIGDGWMEMTHELASISEAMVKVKLTLGGNSASRPRVRNLRVIVL